MYGQRHTSEIQKYALEKKALIVDLRSDTITKPTLAMRQAMFDAEVGDDVFEEDPTVQRLEKKAAELLGKEAAIFVTSGTMGNLISVMNHCDVRGCELYLGADSHIANHEQAGSAQIGGVSTWPLANAADGSFDLAELECRLRDNWQHEPFSRLVAVENTINGRVLPQAWVERLAELARRRGLKLHLDGARIWNASAASGLSVRELARHFDSVTFCLSKGLGAPAGSLLCGSSEFVRRARRLRKVLGGGMRQVGVLAAAGIVALDEVVPLLKDDHRRARQFAQAIHRLDSDVFKVDLGIVHTNMVMLTLDSEKVTASEFVSRLQSVEREDVEDDRILVRGLALTRGLARFAFYHEITDELTHAAIKKINYVIKEFETRLCENCVPAS